MTKVYNGQRPGRQRGVTANVGLLQIDNSKTDDTNLTATLWFDATSGTYTLSYGGQTTAAIAYNANAAAIETAFELLSTITNVTVSGSGTKKDPFSILFVTPGSSLTAVSGASSLVNAWVDADRVS